MRRRRGEAFLSSNRIFHHVPENASPLKKERADAVRLYRQPGFSETGESAGRSHRLEACKT
ncbi:hypothetical protein ISS30_04825 [bacterium]|nr:hypothetical protein [FCB group bacterium]MBL7190998.1 hypothetical protein [bacterium]